MPLLLAALIFAPLAQADPLPKPEWIQCRGYHADQVSVFWKDNAPDESAYKVERKIGDGDWEELPALPAHMTRFDDDGVDTSLPNRQYRVRSYRASDDTHSPYSDVCNNRRIYDPGEFRFFYGILEIDDCPRNGDHKNCLKDESTGGINDFVLRQDRVVRGSMDGFARVGFLDYAYPTTCAYDKMPINIVWSDGGGSANECQLALSPLIIAEKEFNVTTRAGDPAAWVVPMHEAFHFVQRRYGGLTDPARGWVIEGQARSVQDKICVGADRDDCEHFDDIETGHGYYIGAVQRYLGNPSQTVVRAGAEGRDAALFWTYLTEKYGTSAPDDPVEGGMNLMVEFWEDSAATPGRDGIAILDSVFATLGHTVTFSDVWKDFAVANYAKDLEGPGVRPEYLYADMAEPGGNYGEVRLDLDVDIALDEQVVDTNVTVKPWAAHYYEVRPAPDVPVIDIQITQDSSFPLYYTILAIKGTDVAFEHNQESRHLGHTLVNDEYDKVVVVVAGLANQANYRYSFNGTKSLLHILSPTTENQARVGDPLAPDKFLVTVEVVGSDGTPLAGVDLSEFSFRIGSEEVQPDEIVSLATVQGQQWFVIRAPMQSTADEYDLEVSYGADLTETESLAVDYTPRLDADSVLVIDRSDSMADYGKMAAAKGAAGLFVDSWRDGDQLGVVSFNHSVDTPLGLTPWTDSPDGGSREDAFNAIGDLTAVGGTALGDALRRGWGEVEEHGNPGHDWAVVMLSDGLETAGVEEFVDVIEKLRSETEKKPVVHTVAVGPDADRPGMQRAANRTGGLYQYVSEPTGNPHPDNLRLDMDLRYRMIASRIAFHQPSFRFEGPVPDTTPDRDLISIPVEGLAAEMVLALSWDNSGQEVVETAVLRDPDDNIVDTFQLGKRHMVWRIAAPSAGEWTLKVTAIPGPLLGSRTTRLQALLPPYLIQVSLLSDLTMDVFLPTRLEERTPGAPMPIVASLTDTGPITGATVTAKVLRPDLHIVELTLRDDGAHGDGKAGDGIYAETLYQTGRPHSYSVFVEATGKSIHAGEFRREQVLSFNLTSEGDRDGDDLPNEWEERYGTDPDLPDAGKDSDGDGVTNVEEWKRGTDPWNSDTDGGGEGDRTDPNPLDPSDDVIEPTWIALWPKDGEVAITYALRPSYTRVDFHRSEKGGPFGFLQKAAPGDGMVFDTAVANDREYCYRAVARDAADRESALSEVLCTTPREDPVGPHGYVEINDGVSFATVRGLLGPRAPSSPMSPSSVALGEPIVKLTLWASDEIDPEHLLPGDEVLLPGPESATSVAEMKIGNRADLADGAWEPYVTRRDWKLDRTSGLATVFVRYRDETGNESEDLASASIHVLPAGAAHKSRSYHYWREQYEHPARSDFDEATLEAFLAIVGRVSAVFNELRDASTVALAADVLEAKDRTLSKERNKLDRELLRTWLNLANGAILYDEEVDLGKKNGGKKTFGLAMGTIEEFRLNPTATEKELRKARKLLNKIDRVSDPHGPLPLERARAGLPN